MSVKNETYEVLKQAMIFGQWRSKGDEVEMSQAQARFLLLNETVKLKKATRKSSSTKAADETKA
ncbi:hypothetical protein [Pseudovibrio sp. POLY-S9]|uniref:hypothetical protein n=1 Tax=Pseudovibrio sp. POLY-S9 TaxID=1576596 RepID=UPI00070A7476|nr:hypothetical protein [Pseudovibrio sp. POLY-S9]